MKTLNKWKGLALALVSALTIYGCVGGSSSNEDNISANSPSQINTSNTQTISYARPSVRETEKGVLVEANKNNQVLKVLIENSVVLKNDNRDLNYQGVSDTIKVPSNSPKIDVEFQDPDPYDVLIYSGMNLDNVTLSNAGIPYTHNATDVVNEEKYGFNPYFKVKKDSTTNKATYYVQFNYFPEGSQKTLTVGAWDNLDEGIVFDIPLKTNVMPTIEIQGSDTCPLYFNPNTGKYEVPTKDSSGNAYFNNHCFVYVVNPGSDDSADGDTTSLALYEGTNTVPDVEESLSVLESPYSNSYNLSSNLSAGEERSVKFVITQNLLGNETKQDVKEVTKTLYGANDSITMDYCITTNLDATDCVVGAQGDPYGTKLSNEFVYDTDVDTDGDGVVDHSRYYLDANKNGQYDDGEDIVLIDLISTGGYILPSKGGKVFFKTTSYSGTGGNFEFDLWKNGSVVQSFESTNPANWSYVYDATSAQDCSSGWDQQIINAYKLFGNYKSYVGGSSGVTICRNNPTQ